MMGTSQVTRTRAEMERLTQKIIDMIIIILTYLLRSLLDPAVHTTIDWTTDIAATVAGNSR